MSTRNVSVSVTVDSTEAEAAIEGLLDRLREIAPEAFDDDGR